MAKLRRRRRRDREQPVRFMAVRALLKIGIRHELRTNEALTEDDRQRYEAALDNDEYLEAGFQAARFEFPEIGNGDGSLLEMIIEFVREILEMLKGFGFIPIPV